MSKTGLVSVAWVLLAMVITAASPPTLAYDAIAKTGADFLKAIDPALGINVDFGRWVDPINLVYDPDGAPARFADPDHVLVSLQEAVDEWELVSGIQFNVIGADRNVDDDEGSFNPDSKDGLVRVSWMDIGGNAGRAGPNSDFYDMDLGYYPYIDGVVRLSDDPDIWDRTNLVDVLVHELGHLIGLGHSDNPDSVMYANPYNDLRHVRADDIRAARVLYGEGTLDIDDIDQPIAQWLYTPLPEASASDREFLFKPNQIVDQGAYISIETSDPVQLIDDSAKEDVFAYFHFSAGVSNREIDIDATIVFVDPFGYVYSTKGYQISCQSGFSCGFSISIATTNVLKTIPGDWTIFVEHNETRTNLLTLPFTVDTSNDYNRPPLAEVTVTGSGNTAATISLEVSDPESDNITVIWHEQGNLGDQDNDGFADTSVIDSARSGETVSRDVTFLSADTHTIYLELIDDQSRYDGSEVSSSSAGKGFQSLISITVDLPVASDSDVSIATSFRLPESGAGSIPDAVDPMVRAIATSNVLELITTSDGSPTTARFGAGASLDAGASTGLNFTDGSAITIAGSVLPQFRDLGKAGEFFVVLLTDSSLTYRDLDGNYQAWKGSLKIIEPAYTRSTLRVLESIEIFSGNVHKGLYRVFLGYRLAAGGPIHFNARAFRIQVE